MPLHLKDKAKADRRDVEAKLILDEERRAREEKTARLRRQRLAAELIEPANDDDRGHRTRR